MWAVTFSLHPTLTNHWHTHCDHTIRSAATSPPSRGSPLTPTEPSPTPYLPSHSASRASKVTITSCCSRTRASFLVSSSWFSMYLGAAQGVARQQALGRDAAAGVVSQPLCSSRRVAGVARQAWRSSNDSQSVKGRMGPLWWVEVTSDGALHALKMCAPWSCPACLFMRACVCIWPRTVTRAPP